MIAADSQCSVNQPLAVFTRAISAGDFARRHDLGKNDPVEIAAVNVFKR